MGTLQALREASNKSLADMAQRLFMKQSDYDALEAGDKAISYWQAKQIAAVLGENHHLILRDEYKKLKGILEEFIRPALPPCRMDAAELVDQFILSLFANDVFGNFMGDLKRFVESCGCPRMTQLAMSEIPLSRLTSKLQELQNPENGLTIMHNGVTYPCMQEELVGAIAYRLFKIMLEGKSGGTIMMLAEREYGGMTHRVLARQTFLSEAFLPTVNALMRMFEYLVAGQYKEETLTPALLKANACVPKPV